MTDKNRRAIEVLEIEGKRGTSYPEEFRREVENRRKRAVGDHFGLTKYGVNYVELEPGSWSAQRHWHSHEDELIFVTSGELTLITDSGEQRLTPGMVAGFPAGVADGHHLVNRGETVAAYLEIGDRDAADEVFYPDVDLELRSDGEGGRVFRRRDGSRYQ